MKSHKVPLIGLFIGACIIAGAFAIYWFTLRSPKLVIQPSPESAQISVDGTRVNSTTIATTIGSHAVEVSAPDFVTYHKTITVKRTDQVVLPVLLKPIPSPIIITADTINTPDFVLNGSVYFLGNGGKTIYRTKSGSSGASPTIEPMTPDILSGVEQIIWRPDGEVAFLKRADGIYLYDFKRRDLLHQTDTLWGQNIDAIAWSPKSDYVVYTYYSGNEKLLKRADIQNKNTTILANLDTENVDHPSLQWSPNGEQILLIPTSSQKKTNYMYTFDIFSKKISQLSDAGEVIGARFSPDGAHIAYVAPGRDQTGAAVTIIWVANSDGSGIAPLNLSVQSISEIAWLQNSQSVVTITATSTGEKKLVNLDLSGHTFDYQYHKLAQGFSPDFLISIPKESKILYLDHGQLQSLSLINPTYD